jgi:hypothetical protein
MLHVHLLLHHLETNCSAYAATHRPTVAPSTELRKNYDLAGKLNINKWEGASPKTTSAPPKPAPSPAPKPAVAKPAPQPRPAPSPAPAPSASASATSSEEKSAEAKTWVPRGNVSAAGKAFEARGAKDADKPFVPEPRGNGSGGMESQRLQCDPACRQAVDEVRDDASKLDWVAFKYASRSKLEIEAKGEGGCVLHCMSHIHINPPASFIYYLEVTRAPLLLITMP